MSPKKKIARLKSRRTDKILWHLALVTICTAILSLLESLKPFENGLGTPFLLLCGAGVVACVLKTRDTHRKITKINQKLEGLYVITAPVMGDD